MTFKYRNHHGPRRLVNASRDATLFWAVQYGGWQTTTRGPSIGAALAGRRRGAPTVVAVAKDAKQVYWDSRFIHFDGEALMAKASLTIEEVRDPDEVARSRVQIERGRQNSQWLAGHWHELLPGARGRFVAVAGQEAFVADSAEEAWASAQQAHPDDDGAFVQYVFAAVGPRAYANRRLLADLR